MSWCHDLWFSTSEALSISPGWCDFMVSSFTSVSFSYSISGSPTQFSLHSCCCKMFLRALLYVCLLMTSSICDTLLKSCFLEVLFIIFFNIIIDFPVCCSLAVRDLSNVVTPEDIVISEHLVTLLAVVPKYSQKDWMSSYETLTNYVVPRTSKKLHEDNEYALNTVTLFSRIADNFRTSARGMGFQIRDFEYSPEAQETRKQELEKLMQDQENTRSYLLQCCYASVGEVFSSWMHFCAVRIVAESILRYGLPPSFLSVVLAAPAKSEKQIRTILEELCGSANSTFWKSEDEVGLAHLGSEAEAYPYVSFTINIV